jgi:hypothetical protein
MRRHQAVARSIEAFGVHQFGVFSRRQALDLGATRHVIEARVSSAVWILTLPDVFRVAAVPRSRRQRAMAAALWSDGLVSHATAAELWGLEGVKTDEVHVTVPAARRLRSGPVLVHRTNQLIAADAGTRGPIRVTSALRTVIDLAGVVVPEVLEIAIESALRRRLFSIGQLEWRADALSGTGRPGSASLRSLLAQRNLGVTDSGWEVRTAQLLVAAGFPEPTRQHPIRDRTGKEIARADLAYPGAMLVLEYDSNEWHSGVTRRHRDAERRNRLRALGWTVLEVTPAQLGAPKHLLAAVALVLAA